MTVGLGTGSTVAHLLPALAERGLSSCAASPPRRRPRSRPRARDRRSSPSTPSTASTSRSTAPTRSPPDGWLVKGGGGAHPREKIVAAAAERFVVIADSSKPVEAIRPRSRWSCSPSACASTLARARRRSSCATRRRAPTAGVIADYTGGRATRHRWPPGWRPTPASSPTASSRRRWSARSSSGAARARSGSSWKLDLRREIVSGEILS